MTTNLRRYGPAVALSLAYVAVLIVHLIAAQAERSTQQESYPSANYSRIEEGLYVGGILSKPPPGTKAVLNVCETKDSYQAEVHRWEPIPDLGPSPGVEWLRAQVKFIDEQRQAGRLTYIHCRAGVNRSVTVTAAYLMWRDGLTNDEALQFIRAKRPRVGPAPAYMMLLSEWEAALK